MIVVDVMVVHVEIELLVLLMVVDAMLVLMMVLLIDEVAAYGDVLETDTVEMGDAVEVLVVVRMVVVEVSYLELFGRVAFGSVVVLVEVWVLLGYSVFVVIATIVVVAF